MREFREAEILCISRLGVYYIETAFGQSKCLQIKMSRGSGVPRQEYRYYGPSTYSQKRFRDASHFLEVLQQISIQKLALPFQAILRQSTNPISSGLARLKAELLCCKLRFAICTQLRFDFQTLTNPVDKIEVLAKTLRLVATSRLRLYFQILEEMPLLIAPFACDQLTDPLRVESFSQKIRLVSLCRLRLYFQVLVEAQAIDSIPADLNSTPKSKNYPSIFRPEKSPQLGFSREEDQDVIAAENLNSSLVTCEGCFPQLVQRLLQGLGKDRDSESKVATRTFESRRPK